MSTIFPASLDAFTNPTVTSNLNDGGVEHHAQHANANDSIKALQSKLGINDSNNINSVDYKLRQLQSKIDLVNFPATATSPGSPGTISCANGYLYICVNTDTWVRSSVSTW